jgi:hypothetical protein
MADDRGGRDAQGGKPATDGKQARLAEALRANLRRRKAQSAARKDLSESAEGRDDAHEGAPGHTERNNDQ